MLTQTMRDGRLVTVDTRFDPEFGGDPEALAYALNLDPLPGQVQTMPDGQSWVWPSALGNDTGDDDAGPINFAMQVKDQGVCRLAPGLTYNVKSPIGVPGGWRLQGGVSDVYGGAPLSGTVIKAAASWAQGSGAQDAVLYAAGSGTQIFDLSLDLSALTGSASGFHTNGQNNGLVRNVGISAAPNLGVTDGGIAALTWRFQTVYVANAGAQGWNLAGGISDATFIDCTSISAGQHGWSLFNQGNSKFIGCRSEFSTFTGMLIDGTLPTGPGLGNLQIAAFSTDRNTLEGIRVIATGNAPVIITNLMLRRDGADGIVAAFNYNSARCPVIIDGMTVQPGVNDDGTGTLSPVTGINYTPFGSGDSFLQVCNALLYVATGGTPMTGTALDVNRAITTTVGAVNTQPLTYTKVADNA